MSLKGNLRYYAGLETTRLSDDMHPLSNKSKFNLRHEAPLLAADLKTIGAKIYSAKKISETHIQKLVEHWEAKYAPGTVQNKITALRHILHAAVNPAVVPASVGARDVLNKANVDKASYILPSVLEKIEKLEVKSAVRLASAYGLRKEEAIHIVWQISKGHDVEKNNILQVKDINGKASLAKNGRARDIKMVDGGAVLQSVRAEILQKKLDLTGTKIQQFRGKIDRALQKINATADKKVTFHGLRHAYAQGRYTALTGLQAPVAGGPLYASMSPQQQALYNAAAGVISAELGHGRAEISKVYIGK